MAQTWGITTRIIHSIWHHPHIRRMAYICITSIIASAATLTIIAAIMHGFEYYTYRQLQSIHPDITIQAPRNKQLDINIIHEHLHHHNHYIAAMSPYSLQHAVVYNRHTDMFHAVVCYAVDPESEVNTTALPNMIHHHSYDTFEEMLESPGIIIGASLARKLKLQVGDTIYLGYQIEDKAHDTPDFDYTSLQVTGIYETGIEEQDAYLVYISHETYEDIWNMLDITRIGIAVDNEYDHNMVASKIQTALPGLYVRTWESLYPALLSALRLEKHTMIAVFSLLLILASISTIALLYMIVNTKSRDAAILQAMGMSPTTLQRYCMITSIIVTTIASTLGIAIGIGISWMIEAYHIIPLPDAYYIEHLPAYISWYLVGGIWIITGMINTIASWIPSRLVYQIPIAQTLKAHT